MMVYVGETGPEIMNMRDVGCVLISKDGVWEYVEGLTWLSSFFLLVIEADSLFFLS